ncbi:molecular chaperone GrpE [Coxiella burnetii]|uniref:Protein GrpE n=3 Tax=Coxiella burnetii TaxID=777 RepID=GRPE_COXBU|nr:RecName: Full=Protein GrpE; AltName: Full=HSP-70 cofactor [Coxiella burnetii RSA 331]Q83C41.1 RecName: Full=Protein GrpE; AltName: Full=HSP-70 cofactor [Coxiella burnetii RSA 493]AML48840.1 molecular chaperone GrpE [Coxiella burnetii]ABX77641.1 co-chaperone GrpE [Coxiella burnetii RSA 331]AML54803.1 molecular chaperone GrpE [Coxiella burnetii]ARK27547.1 nucleotide exchange factor GrpE [Coxiella burnetii]ATN68769.1 molecular chaperone GrpE [Coxiella burnetii]
MSSKNNPESETKAKNKWEKVMEAEEEQEEGRGDGSQEMEPHREGLEFPSREKLEGQLTRMERKVDEYKTQYLRAQAEMDNLRKRIEREKADIIKFGSKQLITDLLPVADSLIHGLESPASEDPQVKSMRDGMSLTLDLLHNTLAKHGVQVINPNPGDPFDPALHEAMSVQAVPDAKPDTIIQVLQKGYQLNGRVLRAARVIVAG